MKKWIEVGHGTDQLSIHVLRDCRVHSPFPIRGFAIVMKQNAPYQRDCDTSGMKSNDRALIREFAIQKRMEPIDYGRKDGSLPIREIAIQIKLSRGARAWEVGHDFERAMQSFAIVRSGRW